MFDPVILIAVSIVVVLAILLLVTYLKKKQRDAPIANDGPQRVRPMPVLRGAGVEGPRRGGRNIRARMHAAARRDENRGNDDDFDDDEDDTNVDGLVLPEGKIGAKKRKKLEMKAEKRNQRERDIEEREERKQRQKELEERRKREEEKEKEEEQKREEEEQRLKEELAQKELEEYLKLKESFAVEEEGFDQDDKIEEGNKLQEFISYIKNQKVVLLEDLASRFKLKTQDAIDRVQDLLAQELLVGVIDDRGKFICITKEELESVAQFIKQRGRVSISELVESSNMLINLEPETPTEA